MGLRIQYRVGQEKGTCRGEEEWEPSIVTAGSTGSQLADTLHGVAAAELSTAVCAV